MAKSAASRVIDIGPSCDSRATRRSRVWSPSAANATADAACFGVAFALRALRNVLLDHVDHRAPALLVGGKRLGTAFERDAIEARFGDGELCPVGDLVERELDPRRRLGPMVYVVLSRRRMRVG